MRLRGPTRNDTGLPDDVPAAFRRSVAGFSFGIAQQTEAAKFDRPVLLSSSHPFGSASGAWEAIREKANAVREAVKSCDETVVSDAQGET